MSTGVSIEMNSVNRTAYASLSGTDSLPEWQTLSQISTDLANARYAAPPQQKMVVIGERRFAQQEVIDRIIQLRPQLASMTWNGDYLTIARRIKRMADEVGYQPETCFLTSCIEKCFVCTLTPGCRERTLFEEGSLTRAEFFEWQSSDDLMEDLIVQT